MRTHVLQLVVGDTLMSDTYNAAGLNLLSAGTSLSGGDIHLLNMHNVDYVDIFPRSADGANPHETADIEASPAQSLGFQSAIDGFKDLFDKAGSGELIDNEAIEASFNPLIDSCRDEKDVVSLLLSLNSPDDYTYQHSVQVGMLSYYIAKWMEKSEKEALYIGKAGYLHDIGKSRIDPNILQKPGKLTKDEYDEIKKHTIYGFEIIRDSLQEQAIALAALQHHERINGTGYPLRKINKDIHSYARIVAVADVYSAMINNRVYQEKRDLLYVLKELHRMSFGELDPQITQVFIRHMIPNFIGKKVSLSDGRTGKIIMTNPSDFFRPLVKIEDEFLDLSQLGDVEITQIAM